MWPIRELLADIVLNAIGENAIVWVRRVAMAVAVGFIVYGLISGNTPVALFGFLAVVLIVLPRLCFYRD